MPSVTRPRASSSSALASMAICAGCRRKGFQTPMPSSMRRVAVAQAAKAGKAPRSRGFSANHAEAKPWASAAMASSTQC